MQGAREPSEPTLTYHYHAYGLNIESELELDILPLVDAGDESPDILIHIDPTETHLHSERRPDGSPWISCDRESAVIVFPGIGVMRTSGGARVQIHEEPGARRDVMATMLVGGVFGSCMYQRGALVLHASAVKIGSSVIAFTGLSGAGKSTLAAALLARGHELVTDDVLVVRVGDDGICTVVPAFAGLKISPEAYTAMQGAPGLGDAFQPCGRSRHWHRVPRFASPDCHFGALVHVTVDECAREHRVEAMREADIFRLLLAQSLPTRIGFISDALHLSQVARVASSVSILRLVRTDGLAGLSRCAELIECLAEGLDRSRGHELDPKTVQSA